MARRIKNFTFGVRKEREMWSTVSYAPWHEWIDGSIWKINVEREVGIRMDSFRSLLHKKADRLGIAVRTEEVGKKFMMFQFYNLHNPLPKKQLDLLRDKASNQQELFPLETNDA